MITRQGPAWIQHAPDTNQYVILRVAERPDPYGNANRARSLGQLIETSGLLSRAPKAGEYEALRNAAKALQAKTWALAVQEARPSSGSPPRWLPRDAMISLSSHGVDMVIE